MKPVCAVCAHDGYWVAWFAWNDVDGTHGEYRCANHLMPRDVKL